MKVKAVHFYTAFFAIVLFAQLYLPSFKANVFLQIFMLAVFFILEKKTTNKENSTQQKHPATANISNNEQRRRVTTQ